ncbi:SPOR domain-containing protein [Sphingoaurantiacus capsulatus]|uniref:SPOR domain-containing protein n=1 Tax=Sphingoaurantiacus capsulatus TaxID=1771310 RepID=A0ABV7XA84_9SPHN
MSRRGRDEDEDDAPWLAPAAPEYRRRASGGGGGTVVPGNRFMLWVVLLLGLLALVVGLIYAQVAKPDDDAPVYADADGQVPLIRAADGPFKMRPKDPGGLDLEGNNQAAFEAAGGLDPGGDLNFDALPEEPIDRAEIAARAEARPAAPASGPRQLVEEPEEVAEAPKPKPAPKPEVKTPPKNETREAIEEALKPAAGGGNFALQLGAFSSEAKANEAWKRFSGRYSYLAELNKSVLAIERDDTKLYRLRATGVGSRAQANNLCSRLRAAGDQCSVVD